ncbi:MAG: glucose-6-phosphate isomerase [Chloroflexota bacterium]
MSYRSSTLGQYQSSVAAAQVQMVQENVVPRLWAHDHTLWKPDPKEITNRLGWLRIASEMQEALPELQALVQSVRQAGYTHALLLGMGGSSLAPEVFRKTFGVQPGYLDLSVLDSTDPGAVLHYAQTLDPAHTLYIVSTKSGGTVETLSFFKYFYNQVAGALGAGAQQAGAHFVAVTDPGSTLAEVAAQHNFRATFLNNPNIGGRYSALSYFGLLPAALVGVDIETLLQRALEMGRLCENASPADNPGAQLGAILGTLACAGRDKVTLIASPAICEFGNWVEQLIAESTGKEGQGILPVVGEAPGAPGVYGPDRLFVYLRLVDDHTQDIDVLALEAAGHPLVRLEMNDLYDLGGQFFLWEIATALASYFLHINPFDQPNVESAKVLARRLVAAYQEQGKLPEPDPTLQDHGIVIYTRLHAENLRQSLETFLNQAQPGAYIALQAYIQPSPESDAALLDLRTRLRQVTQAELPVPPLAVTSGYGPRFLHSTGQLHKGDAGKGLFIQITSQASQDAAIPDQAGTDASSISFAVLVRAQSLGDRQALLDAGRQVIRFHITGDVLVGLTRLAKALENNE